MEKSLTIQKRDSAIDLLESIAILIVLISHGTCYPYNFLESNNFLYYARYFYRALIPVSIPLFFFANGYLLLNKPFDLKKHIHRMIRLIVLTVVWGIITVIFYSIILDTHPSFIDVLLLVWRFQEEWTNHLWFMGALICLYVFFPLLKIAWDNNKKVFFFFFVIVFATTIVNKTMNEGLTVFSSLVLKKTTTYAGLNFFNKFNPFRFVREYYSIAYFCLGGYAFLYKDKILKIAAAKRNAISATIIFISLFCLTAINVIYSKNDGELHDIVWQGFDSIFTCLNCICIWILCLNCTNNSKVLRHISSNTLGIYLIHPILNKATIRYITSVPLLSTVWFNIVYAILILIACLAIIWILKKIPILKKLVSLKG